MDILDQPPDEEHFPVRELDRVATAHGPVFVGCDAALRWRLLVSVSPETHVEPDEESRGIQLGARQLVDRGVTRYFVELVCLMPRLSRLFVIMATDILERLVESPETPVEVAVTTLSEWRELLERAASKVDERHLLGAYGELNQVRKLVEIDPGLAVAWRGPDNERHDIEKNGIAIEVKAKSSRGPVVLINGIQQLEVPHDGQLALIVQVIERDAKGEAIADLIRRMTDLGADRTELFDGLAKLGIREDDEGLRDVRFTVRNEEAYLVDSDFPRLVSTDLIKGHLHPTIRSLTYGVDLSSAAHARMTAEELSAYRLRMAGR